MGHKWAIVEKNDRETSAYLVDKITIFFFQVMTNKLALVLEVVLLKTLLIKLNDVSFHFMADLVTLTNNFYWAFIRHWKINLYAN